MKTGAAWSWIKKINPFRMGVGGLRRTSRQLGNPPASTLSTASFFIANFTWIGKFSKLPGCHSERIPLICVGLNSIGRLGVLGRCEPCWSGWRHGALIHSRSFLRAPASRVSIFASRRWRPRPYFPLLIRAILARLLSIQFAPEVST